MRIVKKISGNSDLSWKHYLRRDLCIALVPA
jgi:hypothetical protein